MVLLLLGGKRNERKWSGTWGTFNNVMATVAVRHVQCPLIYSMSLHISCCSHCQKLADPSRPLTNQSKSNEPIMGD
jgi:hypothetical protein